MLPLRPRTLHQGYEYADCADAASISPSSMAEKIASNRIGKGIAVLHASTDRRALDRTCGKTPKRSIHFS
jgi:hypothetical protein